MKYSLIFLLYCLLAPATLASPEPSLFSFIWEDRENKFASGLKKIPQDVAGADTSKLPKGNGKDFETAQAAIKKFQPLADEASKAIDSKAQSTFISSNLCTQGSPCFSANHATTVQLEPQPGLSTKPIDEDTITKFLQHLMDMNEDKLPLKQKIHKKFLFGGRARFGGMIAHWVGPKKSADKHEVVGMLFDTWKAMGVPKKPTAIRAIRVQTDGAKINPVTLCMYPENSHKLMAKNFCYGRDSKEMMPKEIKKAEGEMLKQQAAEDAAMLRQDLVNRVSVQKKQKSKEKRDTESGTLHSIRDLLGNAPRILEDIFSKREAEAEAEPDAATMDQALHQGTRYLAGLAPREPDAEAEAEPMDPIHRGSSLLAGFMPGHAQHKREADPEAAAAAEADPATILETMGRSSKMLAGIMRREAEAEAEADPMAPLDMMRFGSQALAGLSRREAADEARRGVSGAHRGAVEKRGPSLDFEDLAELQRRELSKERRALLQKRRMPPSPPPLPLSHLASLAQHKLPPPPPPMRQMSGGGSTIPLPPPMPLPKQQATGGSRWTQVEGKWVKNAPGPASGSVVPRPPPMPMAKQPAAPGSRWVEEGGKWVKKDPALAAGASSTPPVSQGGINAESLAAGRARLKKISTPDWALGSNGAVKPDLKTFENAAPGSAHGVAGSAHAGPGSAYTAAESAHSAPESAHVAPGSAHDYSQGPQEPKPKSYFGFTHAHASALGDIVQNLAPVSQQFAGIAGAIGTYRSMVPSSRNRQDMGAESDGGGYGGGGGFGGFGGGGGGGGYGGGGGGGYDDQQYKRRDLERRDLERRDYAKAIQKAIARSTPFNNLLKRHLTDLITPNGGRIDARAIRDATQDPHLMGDVTKAAEDLHDKMRQLSRRSPLTTRALHTVAKRNLYVRAFHERLVSNFRKRDGSPVSAAEAAEMRSTHPFGELIRQLVLRINPKDYARVHRREAEPEKKDKKKKAESKKAEAPSSSPPPPAADAKTADKPDGADKHHSKDKAAAGGPKKNDAVRVAKEKEVGGEAKVMDQELYIKKLCDASKTFPLLLRITESVGCRLTVPMRMIVQAS